MLMPSGILGPLTGKSGLYYVRRTHSGDFIIVPRYRTDAKTPEQLEQRRRFSLIVKISSKLYLSILKPYYDDPWRSYDQIAASVKRSLVSYVEKHGIPVIVFPSGISPRPVLYTFSEWYLEHRAEILWWDYYGGPYEPDDEVLVWHVSTPGNVVSICPKKLKFSDGGVELDYVPYKIGTWICTYILMIRRDGQLVYVLNTPVARFDVVHHDSPTGE